jgi:ABC-type branched-subunit amino acid transport system ATPase component
MIELAGVSVSFGGVAALAGLTATLAEDVFGIIGPNGAGKTTLLNVMSGFVLPDAGSIRAFGVDLLAMAPHARARWGLRRSFQAEQVAPGLTVAENVRVMLDTLPMGRAEREAEIAGALAFVRLEGRRDVPGARLDAFERRMVELAKAVVGAPKVVLLDEPGAGLRASEAAALSEAILAIKPRFGAMTLLVDHDVGLIASTCAAAMVLDFGQLIAVGPTAEVLRDPRVRAAWLGAEEVA